MIRFVDGPAANVVLMLKRAPLFLRVVRAIGGEWDALDQLEDGPKPDEAITAYKRRGPAGECHIRAAKRAASGWYAMGEYAVIDLQPADDILRDTAKWRGWCYEQVGGKG